MTGLLIKDFYSLRKTVLYMIVLVAVLAVLPGMTLFAMVYAAMLPIYAMGYDERSKWDRLACAMPYSRRTVVLSRYALGLICIATVTLLAFAGAWVLSIVTGAPFDVWNPIGVCAVGLLYQALVMPFMFKLGVEKGRMAYMLGLGLLVGAMFAYNMITSEIASVGAILGAQTPWLVLGALMLDALSVLLSVRLYQKRTL